MPARQSKTRTSTSATITALDLLGAIYQNRADRSMRDVMAGADQALAWAVAHKEGAIDVLTEAAERLNRATRPGEYEPAFAAFEAALLKPGKANAAALDAAYAVRTDDVEAAFAIGLAAGLRLAGGARG